MRLSRLVFQVPTRTLVQIRTHAQKYFMKHQLPAGSVDDGSGGMAMESRELPGFDSALSGAETGEPGLSPVIAGGDILLRPAATIRHVALEPLHPGDQLGVIFKQNPASGALAAPLLLVRAASALH